MPEHPIERDITTEIRDLRRRLFELERRTLRLPNRIGPLQTLDSGQPMGDTRFLDFGVGLTATLVGDDYVQVNGLDAETEFDAIVDPALTADDEQARLFTTPGRALTYLRDTVGLTERANVFVRRRTPTATTPAAMVETANCTAPDHVFLWCQPSDTGFQVAGQVQDVTWDHANFTMTASTWDIYGMRIDPGTTKTTMFGGRVRLTDCYLEAGPNGAGHSAGLVGSSAGTVLVRCYSPNQWYRFSEAYNCQFRIFTPGTYNPSDSSGTFIMWDCLLDATTLQSAAVIWTLSQARTYIRVHDVAGSGGSDVTFRCSGSALFIIESTCTNSEITVETTGTPGRMDLRGSFGPVTLSAVTSSYAHSVNVTCSGLDVTGPAFVQAELGTGLATIRGDRVTGSISGRRALSSGTQIQFLAATRANIQFAGNPTGGSGTFKPWTFDATSVRNLLLFAGATGYPAVGTDAGTNNIIVES